MGAAEAPRAGGGRPDERGPRRDDAVRGGSDGLGGHGQSMGEFLRLLYGPSPPQRPRLGLGAVSRAVDGLRAATSSRPSRQQTIA